MGNGMKYIRLGNTGLKVSQLCLGCMSYGDPALGWHRWVLPEAESRPFIKKALDSGINFFDTANAYSKGVSEEVLGHALREYAQREDVVIATKVYAPMRDSPNGKGLSRKAILHELDASLKRLGTEYVDLYQVHRWDFETPVEETLEALNDAVRSGKVRYLGASSMYAYQFAKMLLLADRNGWTRMVSMQPHYNLMYREEEREMLRLCLEEKIGVLPWSPLARGKLARPWSTQGSTNRDKLDKVSEILYARTEAADRAVVDAVEKVAKQRGLPMAQIALAWLQQQSTVTAPIVGATSMSHLDDAIASLDITLTADELEMLESPYIPHPISIG
jgi:aryl-alcohol dehydrogenase-like predicted oxidoreductase